MAFKTFNPITCKQIAYAMRQPQACCLQGLSVWKIPDPAKDGAFYAMKYLNYEEAVYHQKNTRIIALTNLPVAACTALKIEESEIALFDDADPSWMNGILLMEYAHGEILAEYKDTISIRERNNLFNYFKKNTLAACIISNHLDPNESNIKCYKTGYKTNVTFIDMEDSVADSTSCVNVKDLWQDMTEDPEGRPHYYGVNDSHRVAIAKNAAETVQDLRQKQKHALDPEIKVYIPQMIDRGFELVDFLQRKKSKAFYNF